MKYRLLLIFLLLVCLSFTEAGVAAETAAKQNMFSELQAMITEAITQNIDLHISEKRWQILKAKESQIRSFDDPMAMLKVQNIPSSFPIVFDRDPMSAKVIGLSQTIPFPGKRSLNEKMAHQEAEAERWNMEQRKLEIGQMVKETVFGLWLVRREQQLIKQMLVLATKKVAISETRYATGELSQPELFRIRVEQMKMIDMKMVYSQQQARHEHYLNLLLYREPDTPVAPLADFSLPELRFPDLELKAIALQKLPRRHVLSSRIAASEAGLELARKQWYPDFTFSIEYMLRSPVSTSMGTDPGNDMLSLGMSFALPVQLGKHRSMETEAMLRKMASHDEIVALDRTLEYDINETIRTLRRLKQQCDLHASGIIPENRQLVRSSAAKLRVSSAGFSEFLDTQLEQLSAERELLRLQAEYMITLSRLEVLSGIPLMENDSEQ